MRIWKPEELTGILKEVAWDSAPPILLKKFSSADPLSGSWLKETWLGGGVALLTGGYTIYGEEGHIVASVQLVEAVGIVPGDESQVYIKGYTLIAGAPDGRNGLRYYETKSGDEHWFFEPPNLRFAAAIDGGIPSRDEDVFACLSYALANVRDHTPWGT